MKNLLILFIACMVLYSCKSSVDMTEDPEPDVPPVEIIIDTTEG